MSHKLLIPLPILLFTLFFDQLTKTIVAKIFPLNSPYPLIGSFLQFTYIRNPNAAFGLSFGGRIPLLPFAILAILILIVFFVKTKHEKRHELIAIGLILGGALGNLLDRIRYGEVVDFIDVGINQYRWPVFNIADSAVTVGIFLLILGSALMKGKKEKPALSQSAEC
jgi:signal peptidase II